jgi:hypothetical protein
MRQHDIDYQKIKPGCARLLQSPFSITRHINGKTGFAQAFR